MKYICIIALTLFLAQPAVAARQVSGSVPTTTPLQPMPEGVFGNPQNNIQFQDPSHSGQFDQNGNEIGSNSQPLGGGGPDLIYHKPVTKLGTQSSHPVILLIIILVLLAAVGWVLRKNRKK